MYEPWMQVKQCDSEVPEPKHKRKTKTTTDFLSSGCRMDFLKNELVPCQKCSFTWDGNACRGERIMNLFYCKCCVFVCI